MEIATARLLLRRMRQEDREPFAALNADPRVMEHFLRLLDRAGSDAMVERIDERFEEKGYGLWAVEVVGGPAFVGIVGLWDATFDAHFTPAVEVGWRLVPEVWGRGYATEAAAAAIDDGLTRCGIDEVVSFTAAVNLPSRAVMERLGMVRDPAEDFEHPGAPSGHRLGPHVLYRFPDPPGRRARALRDAEDAGAGSTTPPSPPG